MKPKMRDRRLDRQGVLIALAFIALMYVDFFLWRGGPSGLVVGGAFSLLGLALMVQNVRMIRAGRLAAARVVGHEEERSDDDVYYFPVVEFTGLNGQKIRARTDTGYGLKRPPVGARVWVRYDPAGRLACQLTGASRWVVPIVLLTAGAGVLVLVALRSVT